MNHEELRGVGTTTCCLKLTKQRTSLIVCVVVETCTEADERPKSGRAALQYKSLYDKDRQQVKYYNFDDVFSSILFNIICRMA